MNAAKLSRIVSMGIMGIIAACGLHLIHTREALMGRDTYLTKQAASFDHHAAHPEPIVVTIIVGLIMSYIYFGVYEFVAFVILKILEKTNADKSNS
jgi:hypothetical protein